MISANWIGDAVMAMPALQAFRESRPDSRLVMLARPPVDALWRLHPAVDEVWTVGRDRAAMREAARRLRAAGVGETYVMPHSIRSALVAFLGRSPRRIGTPGRFRRLLLTEVRPPLGGEGRLHQSFEYADLFLPDRRLPALPAPRLRIPDTVREAVRALAPDDGRPRAGLIPGAARGPSKCWPAVRFADVGTRLASERGARILLFGSAAERDLCESVRAAIGGGAAVNLAGATSLPEWAALLASCRVAIANDSGGMHLAAAVGVPLVAVYGITDPARTGPLGPRATVLQKSGVRSRDVPRDDPRAREALERISTDEVAGRAIGWMDAAAGEGAGA